MINPLQIVLIGYGRMGKMIESIAAERGHRIAGIVDTPEQLDLLKKGNIRGDIAIDFSQPKAVKANLETCFSLHLPIVEGTTGWHDLLPEISKTVSKNGYSLFYAPNFSIGMNIAFALNQQLAKLTRNTGFKIELSETHHIHKLDAPSGTAIRLANDILAQHNELSGWTTDKPSDKSLLHIEVERIGEVNGIHQVTARSADELIALRHEAFSRQGFALGAVLAAEFLVDKKGVFNMADLLKFSL